MEERDYIIQIFEEGNTYSANKKGKTIGLFWVLPSLNNKIIFFEIPTEDSENDHDFFSRKDNHYSIWGNLIKQGVIPEPYNKLEYDQIPRGRTIYNIKDDKYFMHATSSIIKNKLLCEYIFLNYCKVNDFMKCILEDDRHYGIFRLPDRE